jgi:hypothetical protein
MFAQLVMALLSCDNREKRAWRSYTSSGTQLLMRSMMKPEQFDTMPAYTEEDTAQARKYLASFMQTLSAGVLVLSIAHDPEGTPSFYAAAAMLLVELDPRFPADWVYSHIMTYRKMLTTGYGPVEVMDIMGLQFSTFAKVGREAYEKL